MRFARARTTRRASRQLPRHRVDLATSRSRRVGRMRRAGRSIGEANAPPQRWRRARRGPSGRTFAVPVKVICPPAGGVVRAGVLRWRETIEDGTEPLKQPQARGRAVARVSVRWRRRGATRVEPLSRSRFPQRFRRRAPRALNFVFRSTLMTRKNSILHHRHSRTRPCRDVARASTLQPQRHRQRC